jgi:nicotinate-nucleotide--dimethylbenzimidazole phosphoribosyltransferase
VSELVARTIAAIGALDESAMAAARERQLQLTKPPGSLGRLEELAIQLAGVTGNPLPALSQRAIIVMAADHGVTEEGVSAYPAAVTAQMVANILAGGAAISVLSRAVGARVVVVDIGVRSPLAAHEQLRARKIRCGTANFSRGPALTRAEARRAIEVGIEVVLAESARGLDLVATGDMGIGNTSAASAIVACFTGASLKDVTGRGTGIDDATRMRKIEAIARAIATNSPDPSDALDVLAKVGGLEIGGLAGVVLGAASMRIPVVLDGFIAGAAALVAARLAPSSTPFLIAGHRSVEPGHPLALADLGLRPVLDLDLRLGEGTGAALAMPIIDAALRAHAEMATFADARISGRVGR